MDKLMVLDGDFEAQLRSRLTSSSKMDRRVSLQVLQTNKFAVFQTHLDYLRAGAQIIRTNTYRASIPSLKNYLALPAHECLPMMQVAIMLAKQALFKYYEETGGDVSSVEQYHRRRPLLAGRCGGYSATVLEYDVHEAIEDLEMQPLSEVAWLYRHRVQAFMDAGVDLLAFDSVASFKETDAIILTLRSFPNARAYITFTCRENAKLLDGTSFAKVATHCYTSLPHQFIAIGLEFAYPDMLLPIMKKFNDKRNPMIPLVLYANKNLILSAEAADTSSSTSSRRNFVREWVNSGVRYIGGGAHTNAQDIKEIREQVDDIYQYGSFSRLRPCSYRNNESQSKL